MITIKLIGGQGNQMFQYAYGRRISLIKGEKLKLDTSLLLCRIPRKNFTFRDYELGVFNIKAELTTLSKLAFYFNNSIFILQILKNRLLKLFFDDIIFNEIQDNDNLDKKIIKSKRNIYISGLFNKEQYLSEIEDALRQDFTFKDKLTGFNAEMAEKIQNTNSVSLHIRRGDLIKLGYAIDKTDYYKKAVDYINRKVGNPTFFIFSDDIEWVKTNLKIIDNYFLIDKNKGKNSYIDMHLMSLCKHNIIANSTFSWWGAWLNKNKDKIVTTPKEYSDTQDYMMSKAWIRF